MIGQIEQGNHRARVAMPKGFEGLKLLKNLRHSLFWGLTLQQIWIQSNFDHQSAGDIAAGQPGS